MVNLYLISKRKPITGMGWMEFIGMIGITSKGDLISLSKGQRSKNFLIGILITDPEHLSEDNLSRIKLRFYGSNGQLNQHRCLSVLHISQDQIDQKNDELASISQKSDLLNLSTHQYGVKFRIREHVKILGSLLQYLSKKLLS